MRIDNSTLEYQSARIKSGDDIREKKILLPNLGIRAELASEPPAKKLRYAMEPGVERSREHD